PEANEGYNALFYDRLPSTAQRLASNPKDFDAFIEGVTLYHIVIEATIALTGQRFELETMREQGLTDRGFYRGFTAIARDESRHVNFGIKILQDAVREDPQRFAPIIQQTLVECLPLISGTLDPPDPRHDPDLRGKRFHVSPCRDRHIDPIGMAGPGARAGRDQDAGTLFDQRAGAPPADDRSRRAQHQRDQGLREGWVQNRGRDAQVRARTRRRVARRAADGHARRGAARLVDRVQSANRARMVDHIL